MVAAVVSDIFFVLIRRPAARFGVNRLRASPAFASILRLRRDIRTATAIINDTSSNMAAVKTMAMTVKLLRAFSPSVPVPSTGSLSVVAATTSCVVAAAYSDQSHSGS